MRGAAEAVVERTAFGDEREMLEHRRTRRTAVDRDVAGISPRQPHHAFESRGFSRTVGAEQPANRAGRNLE